MKEQISLNHTVTTQRRRVPRITSCVHICSEERDVFPLKKQLAVRLLRFLSSKWRVDLGARSRKLKGNRASDRKRAIPYSLGEGSDSPAWTGEDSAPLNEAVFLETQSRHFSRGLV